MKVMLSAIGIVMTGLIYICHQITVGGDGWIFTTALGVITLLSGYGYGVLSTRTKQ
jgi:hypothetical protein